MKDELPKKRRDGNYIINLESSTQGDGSHWTCLILRGKNALFCDPFGAPPSQEVVNYVHLRKGCRLGYTTRDIQAINSHNCGAFCLSLLVYITDDNRGKDLYALANQWMEFFDTNVANNDVRLGDFFRHHVHGGAMPPLIRRLYR